MKLFIFKTVAVKVRGHSNNVFLPIINSILISVMQEP